MDKRFGSADFLIVGGGFLLLVASRLPWWTVEWSGGPATSTDAFEYTLTGVVPLVVLLAVSVLIVIVKTDSLPLPAWLVHPYLVAAAVGGAAALIGMRFFRSGFPDVDGVSRGLGLYLAGAAVVIALLGAGLGIRSMRRPASGAVATDGDEPGDLDADDDLVADADDPDDEDEDDLVRRFNSSLPAAPVDRDRADAPPRRQPRRRATPPRTEGTEPTAPPRSRRRQSGPPLR